MKPHSASRSLLATHVLLVLVLSCGIKRQAYEMRNLAQCEFRFEGLSRISLAGVDVSKVTSLEDVGVEGSSALFASLAFGSLPLEATVNVGVRNPTQSKAAINSLEWMFLIDDIEVASGAVPQRVEIAPNGGTAVIPVSVSTDLLKILSGRSGESVINFALNLAGSGDRPSRVTVKVKPSVHIGGRTIQSPGFFTLSKRFSSGTLQ